MVKKKALDFESSRELRALFVAEFEKWKKKNRSTLQELADRCGVSANYLSQVGRYGRIPGKPVLILLAFNFELESPEKLLRAAAVTESWPYPAELRLTEAAKTDPGLLTVRLDMDRFSGAIRDIVRAEVRTRNLRELLGGRPLTIGINTGHYWLFDHSVGEDEQIPSGLLPEFCRLLGVSLQRHIRLVPVPFSKYRDALDSQEIDMYGPMLALPSSQTEFYFTVPLHRMGISVLYRKKGTAGLEDLPEPKTFSDLIKHPYRIAVVRDSLPHLIANAKLQRDDSDLVITNSDDESIDRLIVRGVKKPAHFMLGNALNLRMLAKYHYKEVDFLFNNPTSFIDMADSAFAVRSDWQDIVPTINDSIRFLLTRGGIQERLKTIAAGELGQFLEV